MFMAILAVFVSIKVFLCYKDHKNPEGSSPKTRCRRDLLIGYGAISIFGYIPLVDMFFISDPFFFSTISVSYVLPGFILPLFILQNLKKYQVCRGNHSTNYRAVCVALHLIILLVIAFWVDKLRKTDFAPYFIIWDTLMFSTVRAEFLVILKNGVWLKGSVERTNDAELGVQEPLRRSSNGLDPDARSHDNTAENSVRAEVNHEPRSNATDCQICHLQYGNSVIPSILIGCGHTICEKCVGKLRRLENRPNRVLCPFCKNSTRLPGEKPKQLPKNFAILDIVMEQRSQSQKMDDVQE
ncbi:unnamed protein product [Caenorhabditis brenneri]